MPITSDKEYDALCTALFAAAEAALDAAGADYDLHGDVLEITADNGDKLVVNRQPPLRQIWLAAKSGGRHFDYADGEWRDNRDNREFFAVLRELL